MLIKLLNFTLLFLLTITSADADDTQLAIYDLKIFDYKLGMTYDEAVSTRAFHFTIYPAENEAVGIINSIYIDEIEFNTAVNFWDGSLFKIIARFDPKHLKQVLNSLKNVLGEGTDNSRTINIGNGTVVTQSLHHWIYPGAKIDLIGLSNNAEFATLSMRSSTLPERGP